MGHPRPFRAFLLERSLILLGAFAATSSLWAQQNFFNVASSDITAQGKLFFQEQLNVTDGMQQSNTTLDLGLGHNAEVGINLNGFGLDNGPIGGLLLNDSIKPYAPFVLLNAQKRFELGTNTAISIGAQGGISSTAHTRQGGLIYCNFIYKNEDHGLKLVAGPYHASSSYFGEGDLLIGRDLGLQAGFEKSLVRDKLVLQTDFISGSHSLGEVVPGAAYNLTTHWILSCGYQIPTMGSSSVHALVFEVTYNPSGEEHHAHHEG